MELSVSTLAAVAVAGIFCVYQFYVRKTESRKRKLRERVAYMLWVMANGSEMESSELTGAKT